MNAAHLDPRFAPRVSERIQERLAARWPSPTWFARELALRLATVASFILFVWLAWTFWPDAHDALAHGAALLDRALQL